MDGAATRKGKRTACQSKERKVKHPVSNKLMRPSAWRRRSHRLHGNFACCGFRQHQKIIDAKDRVVVIDFPGLLLTHDAQTFYPPSLPPTMASIRSRLPYFTLLCLFEKEQTKSTAPLILAQRRWYFTTLVAVASL